MEPLETRRMLACRALPFNFSGSTFDQCFTQNFVDDGTTYDVTTYYSEGTGTDDLTDDGVDGIHANAQAMADETEDAFQFFLDRGFDVLPAGDTELEVFIAETPLVGTIDSLDSTWDSAWMDDDAIDNNDQLQKRILAYHEIQHLIQARYDSSPDWLFYGEGIARAIEDRVDTGLDADTGHWFIPEVNGVLGTDANRTNDLYTLRYRSVLWWTWLMDQYRNGNGVDPPVTDANDVGWGALRDFYEELETQPTDQTGTVNDFIADQGSNFGDDFIDYTLALWAHKYNPVDSRIGFIDAEIVNNANQLTGHNTHAGGPVFTTDTVNMNPRSSRYWEFDPASQCDFTAFTFDGGANEYGFSVMTEDGGNLIDRWTSYSSEWARTVRTIDLDNIVGVVSAVNDSGSVDVGHGCVVPTLSIKRPSSSDQAQVGEADNPRSFIARLEVTGSGGGAVAGLLASDFDVSISETGFALAPEIDAAVINAAYVQDNYWLLIQAPSDAEGAVTGTEYDLTVDLGGISSATQTAALTYVDEPQDVMIVLDRSGSMGDDTGKLEAARNAAILLVDELSDGDQGGYVAFDTDATLRESLDQIGTNNQRDDLIVDIANETDLNRTSIGDGLRTALDDYNANQDATHTCHFVLLSDGMENEPEYWADVKSDIDGSGCAVHTIALGPETDEELMQEIADDTGGSYDYATTTGNVPVNSTLTWESNVSRVYDNVSSKIAGRQRMITQLPDSALGGPTNGALDFEDLVLGAQYVAGDSFSSSGIDVSVDTNSNGIVRVQNQSSIGAGNEISLNNTTLDFHFAKALSSLSFEFDETGGMLQLMANGQIATFKDFQDIHGKTVGGVSVSVTRQVSRGTVTLTGDINAFSLFGQELVIDNVAFTGHEGNFHAFVVDDASDELMVTIAWRNNTGGTHNTVLFDPLGNLLGGKRISSHGTNDVWQIPAPMPGTYKLEVKNLSQEYFVTASADSRNQLHLFLGTAVKQRLQGVKVPIVASFIGSSSAIVGAKVNAVVTGPDGNRQEMILFDDGNHSDGTANDGIYANFYTKTVMADTGALAPQEIKEGFEISQSGSYIVNVTAIKDGLRREAMDSFAIAGGEDLDGDRLPDQWELDHGLNPNTPNDVGQDPDMDGLPNLCEFQFGTDPRNSDTDGGGESDGSEVRLSANGTCMPSKQDPLDPLDDRLQSRLSIVLASPEAELVDAVAVPYNQIRFGKNSIDPPSKKEIKAAVFRRDYSKEGDLVKDWHQVSNPTSDSEFVDFDVAADASYEYIVRPEITLDHTVIYGQNLQSSRITASTDPYAPLGSILINGGNTTTSDQVVTLSIDAVDNLRDEHVNQVHLLPGTPDTSLLMRISNSSDFRGKLWKGIQTEVPQWDLERSSGTARVYVQFRDDHGNVSTTYEDMITILNEAPIANDDHAMTYPGTAITLNLVANDTDVDGTIDASTLAIVSVASHGQVRNNGDGTVSYQPDVGFGGSDSFVYTVKDKYGAISNKAAVTVVVAPNPKLATWDGDAAVGHVGDGKSWSDANNWSWTKGGLQDLAPNAEAPGDDVVFQSSPSVGTIDLESSRTVNSLSFAAGYTLANHTLTVTSGNVAVDADVAAAIVAEISGPTGIIKTGPGTLVITGAASAVELSEGTLVLGNSAKMNDLSIGAGTIAVLNGTVMGDVVNSGTLMVIGYETRETVFNQFGAKASQFGVVPITQQGQSLSMATADFGDGEQSSIASTAVLASSSEPTTDSDPDYREVVNHLFEQLGRNDNFEFGSKHARSQEDQQDTLLGVL